MKKVLLISFSAVFLASLVLPGLALAQSGPLECCKIRRGTTVDNITCYKGKVIGPALEGTIGCPLTEDAGVASCTKDGVAIGDTEIEAWGIFCTINTLNAAVDWIFVILIVLAVVFTILGAFYIMMSQGDPGKVDSGRNYIMYAAIGLVAAFIARAIPSIVKAIMGY